MADLGLYRNDAHEYFWSDGDVAVGPLVSITTAIKAVDKSGPLVGWAKKITAEAAVRNLPLIATMRDEGGDDAAIKFLKSLADHKRDKAADLGTRVHALAEAIANGQHVEISEDEAPYVEAYTRWMTDWRPQFIATEYMVCHLGLGYAGTGDLVVTMAGERWRLDTKTSTGVYSETGLQLAAAHYAEFGGRPGDPKKYRVPDASKHGVLHLRPDGTYAVVPFEVTKATFYAFLAALEMWRWMQGEAKAIVGKPVQPMEDAA